MSDITNRFNNSENINVCKKAMWRFIRSKGYRRCVCRKKIWIREVNRKKRVTWCKKKRQRPCDDWKKVIFSDESQIVIGNDNRVYIWRKSDETFQPECICPCVNRKISVMIWGCITYNGVSTLTLGVKPLIHQSELRTYMKVVPFHEKSSFHFVILWKLLNGMD